MKTLARALVVSFFAFSLAAADAVPLRRVAPRELRPADIAAASRDGRHVLLGSAVFDPAAERVDFAQVGLPRPLRINGDYAIVQLRSSSAGARADLERLGVKFLGYLPDNAYRVRVPATIRPAVAAHAAVRWVGDYEPGFKVHHRLWPSRTDEILNIRILPFPDMSIGKTIEVLKKIAPGMVVTRRFDSETSHFFEISIPAGSADEFVLKAAAIDGVSWLEPNDGMKFHNSASSSAIQGNQAGDVGRTLFAHHVNGTGQIVAVADSGLDSDMCFFRVHNGVDAVTDAASAITDAVGPLHPRNKVIGYWVQEGADAYDDDGGHGTHTSGTVAGDNISHPSSGTDAGLDPGDGMAPNAQILFQDLGSADGHLRGGDTYLMFMQALRGGARVHNNSYGTDSKGAYTAYDQLVDRFLFDHDEMTVVFSAGNAGPGDTTTGSPANAKNVVSVGAVTSGLGTTLPLFSSHGPTVDGRIKPDIVAPGVGIISASADIQRDNNNCATRSMQGTSMSSPTVAGGAVLMRQYFADGFYPSGTRKASDGFNASAALVKAVLLNGTLPLPTNDAFGNRRFGWGKIFLDSNLYFAGDPRKLRLWDLPNAQGLTTGESTSFTVSVAAGQEFRATLVWNDPEGVPAAAKVLVNDLDLTVTNGTGTFAGNVFSTTSNSTTGGAADRLNNVEQVRFSSPVGGTYTITVRAANVPGNGRSGTDRQGFGLVVSNATCSAAVSAAPANLQLRTNPARGVDLTWTPSAGAAITQIYRATGANPNPADFRYIGTATGAAFTDRRAQGGYTYSYMIRGADDCGEGPVSNIMTMNAAGLCDIAPTFNGIAAAQAVGTSCSISLSWSAAQSNCPLGPSVRFSIYRSTSPDFVPSGAPYATATGTSFTDTSVVSGTTYYYVVRAEDTTTASSGPNRGNEERNTIRLFATAFGPPGPNGTWRDTAGDAGAFLAPDLPWQISKVEAHSGSRSYHNGADNDLYLRNTCAAIVSPAILVDPNAELSYWARYNLEWEWDGVIVEISADGGATWAALPPAGGYPGTLADTQGPNGADPPANACGYPNTTAAFTGPADNATVTPWAEYRSSLAAYSGKTVRIRWRFASDPGLEYEGFYLDDIAITNARVPGTCTPVFTLPDAAFGFEPGRPARGVPVRFRDDSINAPTSWHWNFGDGSTSTDQHPTHTYATTGDFTVTLTVTNSAGADAVTRTINVSEPGKGGKRRSVR